MRKLGRKFKDHSLVRAMRECQFFGLTDLCGFGAAGWNTPTFIGASVLAGASPQNVTPHASTQSGDLLIAVWQFKDTDTVNSVTWPTGFTQVSNQIIASGAGQSVIAFATKVATGADGAQAFAWSGYSNATVAIITVRFANADSPIDAYGTIIATATVATTVSLNGITTSGPALLIGLVNGFASANTWTPPGSMTEAYDVASGATGGLQTAMAYETVTGGGATGTRTFTFSVSDDLSGFLIAIKG